MVEQMALYILLICKKEDIQMSTLKSICTYISINHNDGEKIIYSPQRRERLDVHYHPNYRGTMEFP